MIYIFLLDIKLKNCFFFSFLLSSILGFNHGTSGRLEDLALSSSSLNGRSGGLGECMCLHSNILGSKVVSSDNNLVNVVLGLGNSARLEKRFDCLHGNQKRKGKKKKNTRLVWFLNI